MVQFGQNGVTFKALHIFDLQSGTCNIKFLKHNGGEQNDFLGSKPQSKTSRCIETDFQNFAQYLRKIGIHEFGGG